MKFSAGDSLAWSRPVPEFPPSAGWTLTYGAAGRQTITFGTTAGTDGASFVVAIAPNITAGWLPGRYIWSAFVAQGEQRHTIARGVFEVLPDPAATAVALGHAQTTLGLIEAALEGRIPRGLEDTTIDGQQLVRMAIKDLFDLREKYRGEVKNLERAAAAAAGIQPRTTIYVRFRDSSGFHGGIHG